MPGPNDLITDQLDKLTGNKGTTELILSIADKIDFHWFEWCFKVGLVALAFLFFKNIIYQLYYYIIMRFDKFVGVGAVVKFDNIVGRIKDYGLQYIVIETPTGYVRIPLNVWYKKHWTQLKGVDFNIRQARKSKDELELKLYEMDDQIKQLKEDVSSIEHPKIETPTSKLNEIKSKLEEIKPSDSQTSDINAEAPQPQSGTFGDPPTTKGN